MTSTAGSLLAVLLAAAAPVASPADRKPLLVQVDHFYLVSADAERLFQLFRDEFQLAEAWPFQAYGDFASGAVSLGNSAMEFVREGAGGATEFRSIAFEPAGDAAAAIAELDRRGVAHGEENPVIFTHEGEQIVRWSTVSLHGLPPRGAAFICDYKRRRRVAAGRQEAASMLAAKGGGPLGVTSIREIVVAVRSVEEAARAWSRIGEPPPAGKSPLFHFGTGPRIRLVPGKREGIERIVLHVRSAERAKRFLAERRMLAGGRGPVAIDPASIGGLKIVLVDE